MESYRIFKPYPYSEQTAISSAHSNFPTEFCIVNNIDIMPEEALQKVGARTYHLQGYGETVRIMLFGCQGDKYHGQKQVAQLMNEVAATEPPDFALVLGDNIYENGASSPFDEAFKTNFDNIYLHPDSPHLHEFPYFLILGNHDGNYHKKASWAKMLKTVSQGFEVEKNQVIHTYITDQYGSTADKIYSYQQNELNIKKLQPWNMPYFYYSLIIGNVQIFCINSNCYPRDYLDFLTGEFKENNQAVWLAQAYYQAKESGKKIILALHHPLHTEGKRAEPAEFDAYQYFSAEEEAKLNQYLGTNTKSHNEFLKKIFMQQNMQFDLILAAHDHYLSYYNNNSDPTADYKICQIKPGGGGGKLQKRVTAKDHPYVACCLENHGFATITFSPIKADIFQIDIYTTEKLHLRFDNKIHLAIRHLHSDSIEQLRHCVLSVCHEYLNLLKQQELQEEHIALSKKNETSMISYLVSSMNSWIKYIIPYPVRIKEMAAADNLRAYFSQLNLASLEELLLYIIKTIDDSNKLKLFFNYLAKYENDKIIDPQLENSFFFLFFKKMISVPDGLGKEIKMRWERLIQSPAKIMQPMPVHIINRI